MHLKTIKSLATAAALLLSGSLTAHAQTTADVIVYGSTPGGFCAAIGAAREGASVILLEPSTHVGGMNTGGLSHCDSNQMYRETVMGLFHEWHTRVVQDYTDRGLAAPYNPAVKNQARWSFEPHVATRVTNAMLAEAGVTVLTDRYLQSVNMTGVRIDSVVTSNGTYSARTFVDGSYEGDLMAAAGVSWTIGREGTADFGESRAGKAYPKSTMNIDGFDGEGNPLPLITTTDGGPPADGDDNIMTYSFRLSLTTNAANKIPMPAPDNYDPARFEVMRRYVAAGGNSIGYDRYSVPGGKVDGNNSIGRQFSLGFVGGAKGWATADEAGRAAIFEEHKQYTLEFIHFLSTDPVFSASQRASAASWGLCADEFPGTDHWPPQLYVRESRRMQGMYVITENDIISDPIKIDPISVSSFPIDSHDCQRIAYAGGGVRNEGTIFPVRQDGRGYAYHVPYRAILPVPAECDNLLVPVALSCTHVGISSLRIEGTWMVIGQSAGIAAALAADQDVTVQDLPYEGLETRLLAQGQALTLPEPFQPLEGIVLDDPDAELAGTWDTSTTITPFVGDGYRYAGAAGTPNDGSAVATFRFTAPEAGTYRLNMAYTPDPTRANNVPVTITSGPHVTSFSVDQTVARPAGGVVREIGTVQLVTGQESVITIGSAGTTGFVILDAIQLALEGGPPEPEQGTSFQEGVSPTGAYTHDAAYVRSGDPDANFNGDPDRELIVGTTAGGTPDVLRALLAFDLGTLPAAGVVGSASLILTTHSNTGLDQGGEAGDPTFHLHAYGFDVDETNSTWNAPGTGDPTAGGTLGTLVSLARFDPAVTDQVITFDNTPEFRSAVSDALAGDGILRLAVAKSNESTVGTHEFARFHDESATTPAKRPELRVTIGSSTFVIAAFSYSQGADEITLSWTSSPGETYRVAWSLDLADWTNFLATGIPPDPGATTTRIFDLARAGIAAESQALFRVEKE
jgi:hypothetical protein